MATDMSTAGTAARVDTAVDPLLARLQDWLDAERAAAARRVGSVDTDAVIADERYGEALDSWHQVRAAVQEWRRVAGLDDAAGAVEQGEGSE